jgi:hypothetical protein
MIKYRLLVLLGLGGALATACSSSDEQPATTASSGAAGQGQAGTAGSTNSAGSAGAGGTTNTAGSTGTAGSAGSAGVAGSSSGGGPPGIQLEDCTGLADGAICDPASGFVSFSSAFCVHEECHRLKDFAVTCWNLVPTCADGQSFGVFEYELTLAAEASCPADATCTTTSLDGEQLSSVLIECGKLTPTSCAANELSSGAMSAPGTHQGKVRCRNFSLEETYCLPP